MQQQHPEWKVGQVAQELGRYWKALSDEERAVYERKALEDKERYAEVKFLPQENVRPSFLTELPLVERIKRACSLVPKGS